MRAIAVIHVGEFPLATMLLSGHHLETTPSVTDSTVGRLPTMSLALGGHLAEAVASSRVLVVGTGGIGCELLKNLVLTGFQNIVAVSSQISIMIYAAMHGGTEHLQDPSHREVHTKVR